MVTQKTQNDSNVSDTTEIRSIIRFRSAIVILKALDVVFTKIGSALNFDEHHLVPSDVLDPVCSFNRNINGSTGFHHNFLAIQCHFGSAGNHYPVFRAVFVLLVTEPFFRQNLDAFDFVAARFVQNGKTSPGTLIKKHAGSIYLCNSVPQ